MLFLPHFNSPYIGGEESFFVGAVRLFWYSFILLFGFFRDFEEKLA